MQMGLLGWNTDGILQGFPQMFLRNSFRKFYVTLSKDSIDYFSIIIFAIYLAISPIIRKKS